MFHPDLQCAARARNLATQLTERQGSDRIDLIAIMIRETGGALITPHDSPRRPCTHMYEIDMLNVVGRGETLDAAITDWVTAAKRAAPLSPTPVAGLSRGALTC